MKKISFLIGSLGGGGAERVTVALADYFCESGYEVFFIAFSKVNKPWKKCPEEKPTSARFCANRGGKCGEAFCSTKDKLPLLRAFNAVRGEDSKDGKNE